jgi:hypothetical protein
MAQKIKSTNVKMREAIRIFHAGARRQTIMNLLNIDESQYFTFVRMMLNMIVYYTEGGKEKTIPLIDRKRKLHAIFRKMEYYMLDENEYGGLHGGLQGKLPKYVILSESNETVANYSQ